MTNPGVGGTESPRVALRVIDSPLLDDVVAKLCDIERQTGIDRTMAIGELILTRFFGGDPKIWRDRRRNKNNSIRRLAERKDCPFCKSSLNEAVGVYVAVRDLPCVRTFGHISASHVASVLRLDVEERQRILERAEHERWSVRELRQNVISLRRAEGERRGRPRSDPEFRAVSLLLSSVRLLNDAVAQVAQVGALGGESRTDLKRFAEELLTARAALLELSVSGPDVRRSGRPAELRARERSA